MRKLKNDKSHQDRLDYKLVIGQMAIMHLRKQIAHLGCWMPAAKSLRVVGFGNSQSEGKEKNPSISLPRVCQQLTAVNTQMQDPEMRKEEVTKPYADGAAGHLLLALIPHLQLVDAPLM